jgi:RimJ/RimL family protein N-acetyltransferase
LGEVAARQLPWYDFGVRSAPFWAAPGNEVRIELDDGRIRICLVSGRHVTSLFEAARESVREVSQWLDWCHDQYSLAESKAWIEAQPDARRTRTAFEFAIEDIRSCTFLGAVGVNLLDWSMRSANLGYWVRTSAAGRGFATAAARLAARFAFEDLGLAELQIVAAADNQPSQKVAQKLGARREGLRPEPLMIHGIPYPAVRFWLRAKDLERTARKR